MLTVLRKHGYLTFARPQDGSYDPVCFDYRKKTDSTEPAVVRIDHEEILCRDRIRIKQIGFSCQAATSYRRIPERRWPTSDKRPRAYLS